MTLNPQAQARWASRPKPSIMARIGAILAPSWTYQDRKLTPLQRFAAYYCTAPIIGGFLFLCAMLAIVAFGVMGTLRAWGVIP